MFLFGKKDKVKCIQTLQGHSNWVLSVIYLPDKDQLVSASYDKTLKIWSLASGQCVQTLQGHSRSVDSVIYLPDKNQLVSASKDKTLKIWSLRRTFKIWSLVIDLDEVF